MYKLTVNKRGSPKENPLSAYPGETNKPVQALTVF